MNFLNKIFSNKKKTIIFSALVLALFVGKTVFAVWNGTFYEPGDTLNPECLPTQTDCDVRPPLTAINISDTAYDATSWDGDTTHTASKNAIRDKIETLATVSHNAVTLGTANGLSLATQVLSLALASTSTTGALSDTDWNTFNNKQNAITVVASKLLGRGSAGGDGSPQDITLGTGLSMSGTTLNNTVTGISNSAGTNVIPKSDGTNLVASSITDDGTGVIYLGIEGANSAPNTLRAGAPTQASGGTTGTALTIRASDGVAGSSTPGYAVGGSVTIRAGDSKRLSSGDANGGSIYLTPGSPIGAGTYGSIVIPDGASMTSTSGFGWSASGSGVSLNVSGESLRAVYQQVNTYKLGLGSTSTPTAILNSTGTGAVAWGLASATPQAYTHTLAANGTGTNIAGANATLSSGLGTGSAVGSRLLLGGPVATTTGTTQQTLVTPVSIGGEVTADGTNSFLNVIGTLPASPSAYVAGVTETVTSAGSAAQQQYGHITTLAAGFTGAAKSVAVQGSNVATGSASPGLARAAVGIGGYSRGTGAGQVRLGVFGHAQSSGNGVGQLIGSLGLTYQEDTFGNATQVGVMGTTNARGAAHVAGYFFSDGATAPTGVAIPTVSATLLADNTTEAIPIFLARDNSATVFSVEDGGILTSSAGGVAGTTKWGLASATPQAYTHTLSASSRGGTDTDIAGATLTLQPGLGTGNATGANLYFATPDATTSGSAQQTASTKLTILQSGSVGIGTTSPGGLLHVATSTTALGLSIFEQASTDTDGYDLSFRKARGTVGVPTTVVTGDSLGLLNAYGYDGASYVQSGKMEFASSGTIDTGRVPGRFAISLGVNHATTGMGERFVIVPSQYTPSTALTTTINALGTLSVLSAYGTSNIGDSYGFSTGMSNAFRADSAGIGITAGGPKLGSSTNLAWSSTASWYDTLDLYLGRSGANTLRVSSDGSNGAANLVVNGNVGIGTTSPGSKLDISAGTIADGASALNISGILPTSPSVDISGTKITVTDSTSSHNEYALGITLASTIFDMGATPRTAGINVLNASRGYTGANDASSGNYGIFSEVANTQVSAHNVGLLGKAVGAAARNIGVAGVSANSTLSYGVVGSGSTIGVIGYLGGNTLNTVVGPGAVIADNYNTTSPIFAGYDNNSKVWSVENDAYMTSAVGGVAGTVKWGIPAASPQAYTHTLAANATGADVHGATATIQPGLGTGNATGSNLYFATPDATTSGSTQQTATTKMTLLQNGNVGIGTTSPAGQLHLSTTTDKGFLLGDSSNPYLASYISGTVGGIQFGRNGAASGGKLYGTNGGVTLENSVGFVMVRSTYASGSTVLGSGSQTGGVSQIYGSINVSGLGSTKFKADLNSARDRNGTPLYISGGDGGATDRSGGNVYIDGGTATGTGTAGNIILGSILGNVGIGITGPSNILHVTGTPAAATHVARIANTLGGTTQNNGLLILAGNDTGVNAPEMITFQRPDTTVIGSISQNAATTVAFNTSSDQRIKENIVPTTYGLSDLMKINVSDFTFINDPNKQKMTGFIAQELNKIFPGAVTTNGDDGVIDLAQGKTPWMIDYSKLSPLIVKAIQDMNLKIEDLALPLVDENDTKTFVERFFGKIALWLADAGNGIANIFVKEVNTNTLCVSDDTGEKTCITKAQLDALLLGAGTTTITTPPPEPTTPSTSSGQATPTPDSTPVPEPTPAPEPAPEPTPAPDTTSAPDPDPTTSSGSSASASETSSTPPSDTAPASDTAVTP